MFDRLIETSHAAHVSGGMRGGAIALTAHAAIMLAAIAGTMRGDTAPAPRRIAVAMPLPAPAPTGARLQRPAPVVLPMPSPVGPLPPIMPPDGLSRLEAPGVDIPAGGGGDDSAGFVWSVGPAAVWSVSAVEAPPELLAGPPPVYPELLRRAGVEGRVVLEAVLDTLGRAERASIQIVAGPHPALAAAARDWLAGALFRPARVGGRAVRVLVRVPVRFTIRG